MKNKSTQEKVVLELLTNLDTWVSGDYLAKKFQVSRETIWKAINNLKNKRDSPIVSRKKRGYMLHTAPYLEADLINIYRVDCKFNPNFGQICQHNLIRCLPVEYFKRSLVNLE